MVKFDYDYQPQQHENVNYRKSRLCGKNIYCSEADAKMMARHRQQHDDVTLDIYYCRHCFGWHLTSRKNIF